MGDELKFPGTIRERDRDSLDESLTALIRDAYAPPGGENTGRGSSSESWRASRRKRRGNTHGGTCSHRGRSPALIAAAAIFAIAGVINQQLVESDSQLAYDSVIQSPTPMCATSEELISLERGTDGATLNYFLSH